MRKKIDFEVLFESIAPPEGGDTDKACYAVVSVPNFKNYFVGKDRNSHACLLVVINDSERMHQAPIQLESFDVQFSLRCQYLKKDNDLHQEGVFNVIRCKSHRKEIIRYFLSICETVVCMVGYTPTQQSLATVIYDLASIFQKINTPSTRTVNGLFGELYLILRSTNIVTSMRAWRDNDLARYDFVYNRARIDVKTSSARERVHTFSYEQCSPQPGTVAIVASLFVQKSAGGSTLYSIMKQIEWKVAGHPDLVMKLHKVISSTLGCEIISAFNVSYNLGTSDSSLRFYDLRKIPAIREPLQTGVSNVHFNSNLSLLSPLSVQELTRKDPNFFDLLPSVVR